MNDLTIQVSYNIAVDEMGILFRCSDKSAFITVAREQRSAVELLLAENIAGKIKTSPVLSDGQIAKVAESFIKNIVGEHPLKDIQKSNPVATLFPAFPLDHPESESRPLLSHYFRLFRLIADYLMINGLR